MDDRERERAIVRTRVRVPPFAGLGRPRLTEPLLRLGPGEVGVIVAPAGAGKTTLLAEVALASESPVAWLTLDAGSGEPGRFLAHLAAAIGEVAPGTRSWGTVEDALVDLQHLDRTVLLVLDDVHAVLDQPTLAVIDTLAGHLPDSVRLVAASRSGTGFEVARRRLASAVVEITADDLRFRTWEVDWLFRDLYGVRLGPDELPRLTRITEGWAAGLQLFHLATQGRPRFARDRLLATLGVGTRFARDYLTSTVLDTVSPDVRRFLVHTAVFDELTPHRCNLLLDGEGSGERLAELARRGLFTFMAEDRVTYRYHEVLRSYLLETLVSETGEAGARAVHRRAGEILEGTGAIPDAVRSYSRSQDWEAVQRLLGDQGASLADAPGAWIDTLPNAIRDTDPWVQLAVARRLVVEGSLTRARDAYRQALERLRSAGGSRHAVEELRLLDEWLRPTLLRPDSWVRQARQAFLTGADTRPVAAPGGATAPPDELGDVSRGLGLLLGGDVGQARQVFAVAAQRPGISQAGEAAALIGEAVTSALAGEADAPAAAAMALAAAELLSYPAVSRLARAAQHVAGRSSGVPFEHLLAECTQADDHWGAAVVSLLEGLALLAEQAPASSTLRHAEECFAALNAPVAQDWCRVAGALAACCEGTELPAAARVECERAGRRVGLLPHALALLVVADGERTPEGAERLVELATGLAQRSGATGWFRRVHDALGAAGGVVAPPPLGLDLGGATAGAWPAASTSTGTDPAGEVVATGVAARGPGDNSDGPAQVFVQCLGGFTMVIDDKPVDLAGVRPRHLQLLKVLALQADRKVPRDRLIDWLWPTLDPERGAHSLQVAVSALRRVLAPVGDDGASLLRREGDGYRLVLAAASHSDVRVVDDAIVAGRRAMAAGDHDGAGRAYRRAIDAYGGDLLPDVGAEEWVVDQRERLRLAFGEACLAVADALAGEERYGEAARMAQRGLEHVASMDGLWRRAISSLESAGDHAAAGMARANYAVVLANLGVGT